MSIEEKLLSYSPVQPETAKRISSPFFSFPASKVMETIFYYTGNPEVRIHEKNIFLYNEICRDGSDLCDAGSRPYLACGGTGRPKSYDGGAKNSSRPQSAGIWRQTR